MPDYVIIALEEYLWSLFNRHEGEKALYSENFWLLLEEIVEHKKKADCNWPVKQELQQFIPGLDVHNDGGSYANSKFKHILGPTIFAMPLCQGKTKKVVKCERQF